MKKWNYNEDYGKDEEQFFDPRNKFMGKLFHWPLCRRKHNQDLCIMILLKEGDIPFLERNRKYDGFYGWRSYYFWGLWKKILNFPFGWEACPEEDDETVRRRRRRYLHLGHKMKMLNLRMIFLF
jgi:hypothetical protein